MSTQKYLECEYCGHSIDVSDIASEYANCSLFYDGAELDIPCTKCHEENRVEVKIHVSYEHEPPNHGDIDL